MYLTLSLIFGAVGALYIFFQRRSRSKEKIWLDQRVPFINRSEIASAYARLSQKISFVEFDKKVYEKAGEVKFFGYVEFGDPVFYVKDVDLIKQILIKDFDYFSDRKVFEYSKEEAVFARMLTNTTGKEWKDLRSVMTPTFSTGKIKRMFPLFNQCGEALVKYLKEKRSTCQVWDFQEAFGRFTLAAIAVIAFGQQTDAFEDNSTFRKMVTQMNKFSFLRLVKFLTVILLPRVAKALNVSIAEPESHKFFSTIIQQNIKQRRAEGSNDPKRNDFLQLLLEAQAGQLKTEDGELGNNETESVVKEDDFKVGVNKKLDAILDDTTILAQSLLFFIAGADTMESALDMIVYELALNQDVQEKLANEIREVLQNYKGELTYEALNDMQYLDMVVSETMRLHPPGLLTERQCTKNYTVPNTTIVIPEKTRVVIPIRQIHHDPKYYPDPLKFNPENFSKENKAMRHPYTYLPFGQGPRNCIAMRFALIEAKAAMVHLINSFKIEPCETTPIPFKLSTKSGILKPADGIPLKFEVRTWP